MVVGPGAGGMNFIASETAQKLRGGYYTPPDLAALLTRWVLDGRPARILEPACGDGIFFDALSRLDHAGLRAVSGCERDPAEAQKARQRGRALRPVAVTVHGADFLEWAQPRLANAPAYDAVLGNPPFIRYQYLDAGQQQRAEQTFRALGLPFTRHTNAWVPFVAASLALLRPGGRLGMVVPAELLHILHAGSLRRFLLAQCSRILLLDLAPLWFADALQGVILLLAHKREASDPRPCALAVQAIQQRAALHTTADQHFAQADFIPVPAFDDKWMLGLLSGRERSLVQALGRHPGIRAFREVAAVDVGIVTGANKFFLVPEATVVEHQLQPWAHAMFGRSEHVRGVRYDRKDHEDNRRRGLPAHFLWFGDTPLEQLPEPVRRYLRAGQRQGLSRRYKCRIRTPWYDVPSVSAAPVAMLKRCHHFPRLVLNTARAFTTDTAYRVTPQKVSAAGLVLAFVNSLTALSSELEGRHYGGGVLELVPSEIERVLLPRPSFSRAGLNELDQAVRAGQPPEVVLARQDERLLRPLGIRKGDCERLLDAWLRLRDRRHRHAADRRGG
jgi:adenine-specific DNA-methyltransferase